MKNLARRVTKLEMKISNKEFLIVFAHKGENQELAIRRVMQEKNIKRCVTEYFIIYFNLYPKART